MVMAAEVRFQPLAPDILAMVNDQPIYYRPPALLLDIVQRQERAARLSGLLEGLIENRLLADHLAEQIFRTGFGPLAQRVAGGAGVAQHDHDLALLATTESEYRQLLNHLVPVAAVKAAEATLEDRAYDPAALRDLLGLPTAANDKPMMINEDLNPAQRDASRKFAVRRYRLPGTAQQQAHNPSVDVNEDTAGTVRAEPVASSADAAQAQMVSLWDIYSSEQSLVRSAIRRAEPAAIESASAQWLAARLQEFHAGYQLGWQQQELQQLRQFVVDKYVKQRYLLEAGVTADLHHVSPILKRLVPSVSAQDIDRHYEQNKAQYQQIATVKARHLRVSTQQEADRVHALIKGGMSFEAAVRQFSIAPSRELPVPGDMGVIRRQDRELEFVEKLALIMPEGRVSPPYRMPDGKSYELIWVDERSAETLPKTDPGLRQEIALQLARARASQYYDNTRQRLLRQAQVWINSLLLQEPVFGVKP
jgi:hypothetical protein